MRLRVILGWLLPMFAVRMEGQNEPKTSLFPLFAKNLQRLAKWKLLQHAICQRIATILCVFAFLHSFFECFILPKDAR